MSAHCNAHKQRPVLKTYMLDIVRNDENFSRIPIKMDESLSSRPATFWPL